MGGDICACLQAESLLVRSYLFSDHVQSGPLTTVFLLLLTTNAVNVADAELHRELGCAWEGESVVEAATVVLLSAKIKLPCTWLGATRTVRARVVKVVDAVFLLAALLAAEALWKTRKRALPRVRLVFVAAVEAVVVLRASEQYAGRLEAVGRRCALRAAARGLV